MTEARLIVAAAGPGVTVQDAGRRGCLRYGVTPAGPMDVGAFVAANLAAGAEAGNAAIEVSLGGLELTAEGGAVGLAVAGGAFDVRCDDRPLPSACAFRLEPGSKLSVRAGSGGAWCYVAVAGRIGLEPALGSLATHTRSGLGGIEGRGLRAGDALPVIERRETPHLPQAIAAPWLTREPGPVRIVLGPQDDFFTPETIEIFLRASWRLSAHSDRMAYRLDGARIAHRKGHDIVSDGIAQGAIQIPGDGRPLVLMADRQPTGGYPKIANVIGADLDALAQTRPGERLAFAAVRIAEAVEARRAHRAMIARGVRLAPIARANFPAEFLLSQNLVSGVASAGIEEE